MASTEDDIVIEEAALVNETIIKLEKQLRDEPAPVPDSLDSYVAIDCLPIVGEEKMSKLKSVLKKIYKASGAEIKDIIIPVDPSTNKSYGYAFAELTSADSVPIAIAKTNNYKLDKKHILLVTPWNDFERKEKVADEFVEPQVPEYQEKDNLGWWLSDRREQYAILYGKETEVYWHEPVKPKPSQLIKKAINDPYLFQWSPFGSYFALVVKGRRVIIRAGETWAQVHTYDHHGLDRCEFSSNESYIVTTLSPNAQNAKDYCVVWDVASGKKLRNFSGGLPFEWSYNDKYFARMTEGKISVYEAPSCNLLGKKSLSFPGVQSFQWSPSKSEIAIFIQGKENTPSFLTLLELPSRHEVYRKSLFSVKSCSMKWQSEGKYLCLQVDRHNKSKKKTITSFEIFNFTQKNITTDILVMEEGREIRLFEWEPNGNRFGIIHAEKDAPRVNVSFYQMGKKKLNHKHTMEDKTSRKLFWSPRGTFVVIGGTNGALEFYNASLNEVMSEGEHYMVSALKWDPTGRYVCTYVSAWNSSMEHGYTIHTFKGDVVYKALRDQFYDFQWRPRPVSLLTAEKEAEIRSNLKAYAARYKVEDDGAIGVIIGEKFKEQQRLMVEYKDRMKAYTRIHEEQKEARDALRDGACSDNEDDYEVVVEIKEELAYENEEELAV